MLVGALLDLGIDLSLIEEKLRCLSIGGYRLSSIPCSRAGISATRFLVDCEEGEVFSHPAHGSAERGRTDHPHSHAHRNFRDIRRLIESSGLSEWTRGAALDTFRRLAEAEGKIHGMPAEEVHFHEVGAVDSIVDIVGAAAALEELQPLRIISAAVNVGNGTIECRHGVYPAPGPAAVELLRGTPVYSNSVQGELTTPTGAALLVSLADEFGGRPLMRVARIGYGAGGRDIPGAANALRVTLGEMGAEASNLGAEEQVAVLEAAVDDMTPQLYGYFQEKALLAGALDVFAVPAYMKKNRPGLQVSVVCAADRVENMAELVFAETTTIGLRYTFEARKTLLRESIEVETEFGTVPVKVSSMPGRTMNAAPEYECCRRLAMEKGVPLKEVMAAAMRVYRGREEPGKPAGNPDSGSRREDRGLH